MGEHSRIGASSAYRWFECPGSVALSAQVPPDEGSVYAKQGTAAHWVIEQYFKEPCVLPEALLGEVAPNGCEIGEEDVESVRIFIDYVNELLKTGKFVLHSEAKFDLESIYPGLFGTGDVVLMETNMNRLIVLDYKHGSGIPVQVENNKQLLYYALGAVQFVCKYHKIDYLSMLGWGKVFKEVILVVAQPRCRHKNGAIREWTVPVNVLDAFAAELRQKAEATTKKNAAFKTGDHCRFCPGIGICKAFNQTTMELAKADFSAVSHSSNLVLPEPESLSKDEIVKILDFADLIAEFLKRVEAHAFNLMEHGEKMRGYKLVRKKSNRAWNDEDQAKETLALYAKEDELYTKKFISPAQAEKILKKQKKIVEDLCYKPEGGNTLAPEHDPREEVSGSAVTDFTAMSDSDLNAAHSDEIFQ